MRKGIEQPQLIVYVLFTVILTLAGIYVSFTYLGGVSVNFEYHDYASRLNIITSKMIYSTDCFGVESSYSAADGTHFQKEIGVVNWTKFNKTKTIPSGCISGGENQTWVSLEFLKPPYITDTIWSCDTSTTCLSSCESNRQTCYKNCTNVLTRSTCISGCDTKENTCTAACLNDYCSEPSNDLLGGATWRQDKRNILIFIQNGTSRDLGRLQVRLKG